MCGAMVNYFKNGGNIMLWTDVWMKLFGTTTLWGLDMGFWAAMAAVALIVILMNIIFWNMKPNHKQE